MIAVLVLGFFALGMTAFLWGALRTQRAYEADTFAGACERLRLQFEEMARQIGLVFAPAVQKVADAFADLARALTQKEPRP